MIGCICCAAGSLAAVLFLTDATGSAIICGTSSLLFETGTYFVLSLRVNVVTSLEYSWIKTIRKTVLTLEKNLYNVKSLFYSALETEISAHNTWLE